jgi:hypothetical protein
MKLLSRITTLLPALPLIVFGAALSFSAGAIADDPPPAPTTPAPGSGGRHHNPAFESCKRQADDQKIVAGDARHAFIKNCMKSAPPSA